MRRIITFVSCLMFCFALSGCFDEEKKDQVQEPTVLEGTSASSVTNDQESWESKEIKKMGINKNMSPSEIMKQDKKLKMNQIINWNQ